MAPFTSPLSFIPELSPTLHLFNSQPFTTNPLRQPRLFKTEKLRKEHKTLLSSTVPQFIETKYEIS